nr:MAG TPA: hypothetical protein [Caudoviricetes sp.]
MTIYGYFVFSRISLLIRLSFYTENYCSKNRLGRKYKCDTRGNVQITMA